MTTTYTERQMGHRRTFDLTEERIRIVQTAKMGEPAYDISFPIEAIDPQRNRVWTQDERYILALTVSFFAALAAAVCVGNYIQVDSLYFWPAMIGALCLPLFSLFFRRRVERSVFNSRNGQPLFEVSEYGNTKSQYLEFVQYLENAIAEHGDSNHKVHAISNRASAV